MAPKESKPSPRETWLAERSTYVGASEVAAICGIHPYDSPRKIWLVKKGLLQVPDNLPMKIGRYMEPIIAHEFADYVNIRPQKLLRSRLVRHPVHSYCACNPDRLWKSPDGLATVQLKTCDRYASGDFGKSGTDEVKDEYLVQCGWEMFVCRAPVGYLAVVIGNSDFRVFRFTWTPTMKAIVTKAAEEVRAWWHEHFVADVPPPLTGLDCDTGIMRDTFAQSSGEYVTAGDDIEDLLIGQPEWKDGYRHEIAPWTDVCREAERWEMELKRRKNILREAIGNCEGIHTSQGQATWKSDKNGKRTLRCSWEKI